MSAFANPTPLGLIGFGLSTILLSLHNVGLFPYDASILAMALFVGGFAQIIAGILEFFKGNTFGVTAFTSYGAFWWTLAGIWVLPILGYAPATIGSSMAAYMFLWGLFTFLMFLGTFKGPRLLSVVFGTLFVLFWILAAHSGTGIGALGTLAGVVGVVCGGTAFYLGTAIALHEGEKKILPY
jgi:succinate-acetate transporter protein